MVGFKIVHNSATAVNLLPESSVIPKTLEQIIEHKIQAHYNAVEAFFTPEINKQLAEFAKVCVNAFNNGNKLLFCGNGGSAADAQHIATEFVVRFVNNRKPLPAIALTTDTSALTAIGNDFGYDHIFSRQIEALGKKGDILIAISTSGNSANIIQAIEMARSMGIKTLALGGKTGGKIKGIVDYPFIVPHEETARIQECHIIFLHLICNLIEARMGFEE